MNKKLFMPILPALSQSQINQLITLATNQNNPGVLARNLLESESLVEHTPLLVIPEEGLKSGSIPAGIN